MRAGLAFALLIWAAPLAAQTVQVFARGETVPVGTANEDAADDPAIWRNAKYPERSLIVATDKKAGLYVYDLKGQIKSFTAAGRVNNVALVEIGHLGVIVAASDRNDKARALIQLYRLDTRTAKLAPLGQIEGGAGEAYGVCLWRQGRTLHVFSVLKQGEIHHLKVTWNDRPSGTRVRQMQLASQTESCVVDPRTSILYVGEEDRGVWSFDARASGKLDGKLIAPVEGNALVADVEGLAVMPQGRRGGWLIASSQGDNAFSLYQLPDYRPVGRFRIAQSAIGSVEETDGIEVHAGSFGKDYPDGLFIAQDGRNEPAAQNFKLVAWRDIIRALRASRD